MLKTVQSFCEQTPEIKKWVVALSGGRDSVVLLHILTRVLKNPRDTLLAVHIHHGLQEKADDFLKWCANFCERLEVPFAYRRVAVFGKEGVEANARVARYHALAGFIDSQETALLTAHHLEDQALTVLLQLGRGAGLSGLVGMPEKKPFGKGWHCRPLLKGSTALLKAYAEQEALTWVEDPTNQDPKYLRNQLRQEVWPIMQRCFEGAELCIGRAATHLQQAYQVCLERAAEDFKALQEKEALLFAPFQALSRARQANVLRYWCKQFDEKMPNTARLETFLTQLAGAREDAHPSLVWGETVLSLSRGRLHKSDKKGIEPFEYIWDLKKPLLLPTGAYLSCEMLEAAGIDLQKLKAPLLVRSRKGGERYYSHALGGQRALKKWFQEQNVPVYARAQAVLLLQENELVSVLGFMVSDRFRIC